jgi:hypothetical protein
MPSFPALNFPPSSKAILKIAETLLAFLWSVDKRFAKKNLKKA